MVILISLKYEGHPGSKVSCEFACKLLTLEKNQLYCRIQYLYSFNLSWITRTHRREISLHHCHCSYRQISGHQNCQEVEGQLCQKSKGRYELISFPLVGCLPVCLLIYDVYDQF